MIFTLDYTIIKRSKKLKDQFRKSFEEVLNEMGEMLVGAVKTDYILDVFAAQGYWSGILYNVYFNFEECDFEIRNRTFGGAHL